MLRGAGSGGSTIVASDNFNRADSSDLGANWTIAEDDIEVSSNTAARNEDSFAVAYWSANVFNNNQYSKAQVVTVSSTPQAIVEICCRRSGSTGSLNGYSVWTDGTNWGM